jgi:hypothetical protein
VEERRESSGVLPHTTGALTMAERELIEPHPGDKCYARRNDDGTFKEMDDVSRSLSQDVRHHAGTKKPKNEGDRGD